MKRLLLLLTMAAAALPLSAQNPADSTRRSTPPVADSASIAKGEAIVDNYVDMVDFNRVLGDSLLMVTSYVIDVSHPTDTMTIYRWYQGTRYMRVEMWQDGKVMDGVYSDGKKTHRAFNASTRTWMEITPESFFDRVLALDIRGALYNWRSRGAEITYAGECLLGETRVNRVFVASPQMFDRYYYFEKESGLLFLVTEEDHIMGDVEKTRNAQRVDWRGWHEFIPFHGCLLPSEESYQYDGTQRVVIHNHYRCLPPQKLLFTEDYHKL